MADELDYLIEMEEIRAVERCGTQTTALYDTQELMDAVFSNYSGIPVHSDTNNLAELSKVARGQKASTGAGVRKAASVVPRVTPSVTLRDPLGGFNNSDFEKLLEAKPSPLPTDHLFANPRDFERAASMIERFSRDVSGRNDHSEAVREAEARSVIAVMKFIQQTRQDARAGRV